MALIDRLAGINLTGEDDGKISVHYFWAGMVELSLGEVSVAQFKSNFNLTGSDASDFDWLVGKYQASAHKERFIELMHVIFMLAESVAPGYTTTAELQARINRIG